MPGTSPGMTEEVSWIFHPSTFLCKPPYKDSLTVTGPPPGAGRQRNGLVRKGYAPAPPGTSVDLPLVKLSL